MRKKFRFLTVLAVCVMVLSCFSVTAFAYADDTEQNLPVTEATQPEQQPETTPAPEKPKGEPIDDEGNAYTRDLLYDKATNKQFITVQTKNGNTFFIVIDYDAPINEDEEQYQTYFLNMVDESDLLALLDEDTAAALTTCLCINCGTSVISVSLCCSSFIFVLHCVQGTILFPKSKACSVLSLLQPKVNRKAVVLNSLMQIHFSHE